MAFHPYPQLIPRLCNARRFGPPVRITGPSAWPWVDHAVSGLPPATCPRNDCKDHALFGLGFPPAPAVPSVNLRRRRRNSPAHSSIGTPSPSDCQALTACRHAVSGTVSLPSRGAFHLSLTVLVHYRSTGVFSLGEWAPQLPTGFHVSGRTQEHSRSHTSFAYGALTRSGRPFQDRSTGRVIDHCATTPAGWSVWPYNPDPT